MRDSFQQEDSETVLRATVKTQTTQENIQNWLQLQEGDPGVQLLIEEGIIEVIFIYTFSPELHKLSNFPYTVPNFVSEGAFCFSNPDFLIIG